MDSSPLEFSSSQVSLFQAKEFAHVAVVFFLAALCAQIEAQFIDHLDTVVAQPVVPAIGANRLVDAPPLLIVHWRFGQLVSPATEHAARPLAMKAIAGRGRRSLRCR